MTEMQKYYYGETLGIKQWLQPEVEMATTHDLQEFDGPLRSQRVSVEWDVIFLNVTHDSEAKDSYFENPVKGLFQKMREALQLASTQKILELEVTEEHFKNSFLWLSQNMKTKHVFVMSSSPQSVVVKPSAVFKIWSIHSPAFLLNHPESKKITWQKMKDFIDFSK